MNNSILAAIYQRLAGDATLDPMLGRSVITPSAPGVYSTLPVPVSAQLPYLAISGPISDVPDDTFDAEYREVLIDLHAYASRPDDGGGSVSGINSIAERVRYLFHRRPIDVSPAFRCLISECRGPVALDADEAFGRVIQLRLLIGAA